MELGVAISAKDDTLLDFQFNYAFRLFPCNHLRNSHLLCPAVYVMESQHGWMSLAALLTTHRYLYIGNPTSFFYAMPTLPLATESPMAFDVFDSSEPRLSSAGKTRTTFANV